MNYIYENIFNDIKKKIDSNILKPGDKLDSIKKLATLYNCSKSVIIQALEKLKYEHYIYSIPKSGYFVHKKSTFSKINYTLNSNKYIDFSTGNINIKNISQKEIISCFVNSLHSYNNISLDIGLDTITDLKKILKINLSNHQIFTEEKNIFLNLGILHMLTLLTSLKFPNHNETILIEDPTYSFFIKYLQKNNIPTLTIKRDVCGIDLKKLEYIFKHKSIKFFYTIPRNHNPYGISYTEKMKEKIVKLAEKYNVFIIEDDYLSDISDNKKNFSMFYYSNKTHNIYLKSYSKIIPWIRLGISIIPDSLVQNVSNESFNSYFSSYFSPSIMAQVTINSYLNSNIFNKYIKNYKRLNTLKSNALNIELQKFNDIGIETFVGNSCIYCYIKLPDYISSTKFQKILYKKNILVTNGKDNFFSQQNYINGIRIATGNLSPTEIKIGLNIILLELKKLLHK